VNPLHVAAASVDDNTPWIGPGMLGFIIVVIIGVATWFLFRSMSKRLRRLDAARADREEGGAPPDAEPGQDGGPGRGPEPNGAH
jgi:hypothetical protein